MQVPNCAFAHADVSFPTGVIPTSSTGGASSYIVIPSGAGRLPSSAFASANASLIPQPSARPPPPAATLAILSFRVEQADFLLPRSLLRTRRPAQSRNLSSRVPLDKSEGHPKALFGIKARPPAVFLHKCLAPAFSATVHSLESERRNMSFHDG